MLEDRTRIWLQNHGYATAQVRATRQVDSNSVDVTLRVEPGPRRRIGSLSVEGNASVSDHVVLRELPFRTGQWFSASGLTDGRTQLQQIDLFRQARVSVDVGSPLDSTVAVQVQILETTPRLSLAELGYISEGAGLSGRVQWNHPNFTGGARSLTTSLEIQSGAGAVASEEEKLLRGSVTLNQPYVTRPRLSLAVGPFAEYRDDLQDRSFDVGISTALLYRLRGFSSLALEWRFSGSHIYEYRFGSGADGTISFSKLLAVQFPALIDSLGRDVRRSSIALSGSFSKLDNLANPRRGWSLRPRAEITTPTLSTEQFGRLDLTIDRALSPEPKGRAGGAGLGWPALSLRQERSAPGRQSRDLTAPFEGRDHDRRRHRRRARLGQPAAGTQVSRDRGQSRRKRHRSVGRWLCPGRNAGPAHRHTRAEASLSRHAERMGNAGLSGWREGVDSG